MQISKFLLIIGAASMAAIPLSVKAADTEAQIKAREALAQKLHEMQEQDKQAGAVKQAPPAQTPAPKPKKVKPEPAPKPEKTQPPVAAKQTPPPAPDPVPVVTAVPPPVTPAPAPPGASTAPGTRPDSEAVAKAREALRLKMQELDAHPEQIPAPAAEPPRTVAKNHESRPATPPAHQTVVQPETTGESAQPPASVETQRKSPPKKAVAANQQPTFQPFEAPPSPYSADKQARLAELLRQYRADQLTPEQYHQQRAKIVAEP